MILQVEDATELIHMVKERNAGKGNKAAHFVTKCGEEIPHDITANISVWDGDVTCPKCAIPWV